MAWVKKPFWWKNISILLLENGLATVYIGAGAEYENLLEKFTQIEKQAKSKRKGMWSKKSNHKETPMEFKKRTKAEQS